MGVSGRARETLATDGGCRASARLRCHDTSLGREEGGMSVPAHCGGSASDIALAGDGRLPQLRSDVTSRAE